MLDENYPSVKDEWHTIRAVAAGRSIARFGDGELKMMYGRGYRREPGSQELAIELRSVLQTPTPGCCVGIPTMSSKGPKYSNWTRHSTRFASLLTPKLQYYSAFITRPDSAPWIFCREFASIVEGIWRGRRVAVLSEPHNKILKAVHSSAAKVIYRECPSREAYSHIDRFEQELVDTRADVVFMSCGATATCLANRLTVRGIHAIDIGSAGGFLLKALKLEAGDGEEEVAR